MRVIEYGPQWNVLSEKEHTFPEVLELVRHRSGRELKLSTLSFRFKFILGHQETVGFFIQAGELIRQGQEFCTYGGVYHKEEENLVSKATGLAHQYMLRHETAEGVTLGRFDASQEGDIGALLIHLPAGTESDALTKGTVDLTRCRTANAKARFRDHAFYFVAIEDIPEGAIIGQDYSHQYWEVSGMNPIYFHPSRPIPIPLNEVRTQTVVAFFDEATGRSLLENGHPARLVLGVAALMQLLHISPFDLVLPSTNLRREIRSFVFENRTFHVDILRMFTLMKRILGLVEPRPPPLTFFGAHTEFRGCLPPPHTTFENGVTRINKPKQPGFGESTDPAGYQFGL